VTSLGESVVEETTLAWLEALGYAVLHGPDIAVGQPAAGPSDPNCRDVVIEERLRQGFARLNPELPPKHGMICDCQICSPACCNGTEHK
jgi:type I restriction enzyme R subunit